jgi:alpha-galactosidase
MNLLSNEWTLRVGAGSLETTNRTTGLVFKDIRPVLETPDCMIQPDSSWEFHTAGCRAEWTLAGTGRFVLSFAPGSATAWLGVKATITNLGTKPLAVRRFLPLTPVVEGPALDRVLVSGKDMVGPSALLVLPLKGPGNFESYSCIGATSSEGSQALVVGFLKLDEAFYALQATSADGALNSLSISHLGEDIALAPGNTLILPELAFGAADSLAELMSQYADQVAMTMRARKAPPVSGWCSWYYYYELLTNQDLWENIVALRQLSAAAAIRYIQIDDGWNLPQREYGRRWGDWEEAGALFPQGMRAVAEGIKREGCEPGLWLAPFSVEPASNLFREHPEWMVQDPKTGRPKDYWGIAALDITQEEVLQFIRRTFCRVFDEWGFTYVKIDFLSHAVMDGVRMNKAITTAVAFRRAIEVIREVANDRYILGCGSPMGPAVGVFDAMRVGYDISSRWFLDLNPGEWPVGNCCLKAGYIHPMWRLWMHQRLWQNDPDCVIVRDFGSDGEVASLARWFPAYHTHPPYGLTVEEARGWAQFVWLVGGLIMIGEHVGQLTPERRAIIDSIFPLREDSTVRWVDWYHDPMLLVLRTETATTFIGIFNLNNYAVEPVIPVGRLGIQGGWMFRERLSGETFSGLGEWVHFPAVPAHGGRVWILS